MALLIFSAASVQAQDEHPAPAEVVAGVVDAADALLATLDDAQRQALVFRFDDDAQRHRWSNLPVGIVERRGLRMGDLSEAQQAAVMAVLRATLSERGYQQVIDNVNGDEVLKNNGRSGGPTFGKDEFYIAFLGEPSATSPWMWQFGGHHLAINATVVGDDITLSPSLTGGQPMRYERDGNQVRQLSDELDKVYAFIGSLSEEQLGEAVVADRPVNLLFGPDATRIQPMAEGLGADKLTPEQKRLLLALIEARVGILNPTHTRSTMARIARGLDGTYIAWFGPTARGEAATYRIQGPSVIIEYAPQRMGGEATNHVHAMYREPSNDYGAAFLAGDTE